MAFSITKEEGIFKDFVFEIEGHEVEQVYKTILNELKANAEVDGFRKGKAPEWIIKNKFKKYILEALIDELADKIYEEVKALGYEVMDIRINLDKSNFYEKDMKIRMEGYIEIFPIIEAEKLKDLKDLELEIGKIEFTEELVENAIKEILRERATLELKEGPIEEKDYVILDYTVVDKQDGERVNQKLDGILEELGLRKDLYNEIIGKKEGDVVRLENVSLKENTQEENNMFVDIEVKIEGVKRLVYPEFNDDIARELNLGQTKEQALEKIRKNIVDYLNLKKEEAKVGALTKHLLEEYKDIAEISRTEATRIAKVIHEEELTRLSQIVDLEALDKSTLENIYKMSYEKALKEGMNSAKTRSILVSYAKLFGIEVSDEDIEKYIDSQVEHYKHLAPENKRDDKEYIERLRDSIKEYFSSENKRSVLIKDLLAEKAMDKLLETIKFKEVEKPKEENVEQV